MSTSTAARVHQGTTATYRHATLAEENALATALQRSLRGDEAEFTQAAAGVGLTAAQLRLWLTDRRVPTNWTLPAYAA